LIVVIFFVSIVLFSLVVVPPRELREPEEEAMPPVFKFEVLLAATLIFEAVLVTPFSFKLSVDPRDTFVFFPEESEKAGDFSVVLGGALVSSGCLINRGAPVSF